MFLTETEKQTHNKNMGTSRDFHDNSWRIISSILIVCWVITILYNHTKGTLNLVLVPAILSIGLSIYSIINPRKLWTFGLLATFWGLMYIYISGKIPGFLLFMLGISFDIKSGFFKKFVIPKIIFLFSCLIFVLYHVYKMDPEILFGTDSPWSSGKTELEKLYALDLPEETKNQITGLNAKRILGL